MDRIKRPSILEANLVYLVLGILLLSLGQIVQTKEVYSGLLITEFIIILLPNLLFLKMKGYSLKKTLRLNKISFEQIIYTVFIMIFSYPIAVVFNIIVVGILSKFITVLPQGIPIPNNMGEFTISFFVMALAPGICEEVMFRGTMLDSYTKLGYKKSIIITSLLFGIFHFNLINLVGPAFLGLVLGILVYKTNSIYISIIGHTINNTIALTIGYFVTKYQNQIDSLASQPIEIDQATQMLAGLIFFGIIGAISLFMLILLLKKIPKYNSSLDIDEFEECELEKSQIGFVKYIPVIIVIIIFTYLNYKFFFN